MLPCRSLTATATIEALDGRVVAAGCIAKADSCAAGKPRVWTETRIRISNFGPDYDLAPDGKRMAAMVMEVAYAEKLPKENKSRLPQRVFQRSTVKYPLRPAVQIFAGCRPNAFRRPFRQRPELLRQ